MQRNCRHCARRATCHLPAAVLLAAGGVLATGCRTVDEGPHSAHVQPTSVETAPAQKVRAAARRDEAPASSAIVPVAHADEYAANEQPDESRAAPPSESEGETLNSDTSSPSNAQSLAILEATAVESNPELRRLQQQAAAAWAKVRYQDQLPDPTIGANVFGHPIETAAGSQRANLTVMQMIPWLDRLDAQAQQACWEAWAAQQTAESVRLKVIGDLRANWARLYVLGQQIRILDANEELLKSLIELATARIEQNRGSVGDVTLITIEISRVEEQRLTAHQQVESTIAEINRLAGRPAGSPVVLPNSLPHELPSWSEIGLRQTMRENQPAIAAAHLRAQASRWGVEVARLRRRPDVSVSAAWVAIDDNRPQSGIVDVGRDAWSVGAQVSVPLWREKYDAMLDEATWNHFAAHASVEEETLRFDALLRDLWEQAQAAGETAVLYKSTILPQAQQTLESDQQALANGTVDLDRVIGDVRNLLTLEQGYHRALGQMAISVARIRQAVGADLGIELVPAR